MLQQVTPFGFAKEEISVEAALTGGFDHSFRTARRGCSESSTDWSRSTFVASLAKDLGPMEPTSHLLHQTVRRQRISDAREGLR